MADRDPRNAAAALGIFRQPRVFAMLCLGFSAGLPFPLVFATLTAWLATAHVSKASIGMFAWIGIAYSLKFVWAPLVDRLPLPLLTRLLGRRRSWMLLAQLGVVAGLAALSGADPAADLPGLAMLALLVAFCSATQDISVDAWRIEAAELREQGAMAAAYQFGYRVAGLVAGAGALYIAQLGSWSTAYRVMAAAMGVGLITVFLIEEPPGPADRATKAFRAATGESFTRRAADWFATAVAGPFEDFFRREGTWALVLLLLIGCYRVSDYVMGIMANTFYIDIGFTLAEIATITKVFGFLVTMLGAALGGAVVARYGVARPLVAGAVSLAVANLFFAFMAARGADLRLLTLTISADNLAVGFTGTVFIAYLSSLTRAAHTATQYALFSSLMVLPGKFIAGFSGHVVERFGWTNFFLYAAAMGLPSILLAVIASRRYARA